jgi:hypothetical protein
LGAGFIWVTALWFAFERLIPDGEDRTGALASAERLGSVIESVSFGAVIAFAAYLVGSLSTFLFSGQLRKVMRTSADFPEGWRNTVSPGARRAVYLVANQAAARLEVILSLSGLGIGTAIEQSRLAPAAREPTRRRWPAKYRVARQVGLGDRTRFPTPEEQDRELLVALVIADLPTIASTRLLGKSPDVFSAVDRGRAEVEFRLAVLPPVAALGLSIASHGPVVAGVLVMIAAVLVALGLLLDAVSQQRKANDLVLDLLQTSEITSPSLEQLAAWAADIADRSPPKVLARHGRNMLRAVQPLFEFVEWGRLSAPVQALTDGFAGVATAHGELERIAQLGVPEEVVGLGVKALRSVDQIARAWGRFNHGALDATDLPFGLGHDVDTPDSEAVELTDEVALKALLSRTRQQLVEFGDAMQKVIAEAANLEAARLSGGGE